MSEEEVWENISRLRANDPRLRFIEVGSVEFYELSLHQFCSALQEDSNIRRLVIRDRTVDAADAKKLSAALGKMTHLVEFEMLRCPWMGDEVATILAPSLADRDFLHTLILDECQIGDGALQAISESFSEHNSLAWLKIYNHPVNPIGDVGATAFGSLLVKNKSINKVSLGGFRVDLEGLEAIARGMSRNQTLERMSLPDEVAGMKGVEDALKKALYNDDSIDTVLYSSNHTLKEMYLPDSDLWSLLVMNGNGPEEARRKKTIRFLNENSGSLLSIGVNETLMPSAIERIGRIGGLIALHELVRSMADLFAREVSRKRPRE